ncbi:hypothetical protein [Dyella sp. S184]|uniref:hypothetical protein n=1 Tax=Dyella sp. S184 TaxID=1641862 RepID=UPI00131D8FAD|nr:hypothetical protein [Dyella sp. S184]
MPAFSTRIDGVVKEDFNEVWKDYGPGRLADPNKQRELLRSAHKLAICFSFFAKAMKIRELHRRIFVQELASDSLHLVHALMTGDARGASFYLRSVIENFWRHQYFSQHSVEFGWLQTRSKYHMTMAGLREYCSWLDVFSGMLNHSLKNLDRLYAQLSTDVHSTSPRTLVLREQLDQISLSLEQSKRLGPPLRDVLKDCLVLLTISEREVFDALHIDVQVFILKCLDSKRKAARQHDL